MAIAPRGLGWGCGAPSPGQRSACADDRTGVRTDALVFGATAGIIRVWGRSHRRSPCRGCRLRMCPIGGGDHHERLLANRRGVGAGGPGQFDHRAGSGRRLCAERDARDGSRDSGISRTRGRAGRTGLVESLLPWVDRRSGRGGPEEPLDPQSPSGARDTDARRGCVLVPAGDLDANRRSATGDRFPRSRTDEGGGSPPALQPAAPAGDEFPGTGGFDGVTTTLPTSECTSGAPGDDA